MPQGKILIVDDEEPMRGVISRMLRDMDYDAEEAANGEEALAALRRKDYDAALIDLQMPVMGGLKLLAAMRAAGLSTIPIVLSGMGDLDVAVEAMKQGAFDYLEKPCMPENLRMAIDRAFRHRKASQLAEAMSRLSEQWESIFDASPDMIVALDLDNRIVQCNQAAARRCGAVREDMIGRPCHESFCGQAFDLADCPICRSPQEGLDKSGEFYHSVWKGYFELHSAPAKDRAGNIWGHICIAQDITDRKKVQEALRQVEERHRLLVENLPIGLYRNTPGPKGKFVMANPALARMFGYDNVEEFLQVPVAELYWDPSERKAFSERLMAAQSVAGYELRMRRRDGSPFWVAITARASASSTKEIVCFDGMVEDITERKEAEEKLRIAHEFQVAVNTLLHLSIGRIPLKDQLEIAIDAIVSASFMTLLPRGAIFLVDETPNVLTLKAHRGLSAPILASCAHVPFGRCLCGRAAASGRLLFADCVNDEHDVLYEGMPPHGHYITPIMANGKTLGVIVVYVEHGHRFNAVEAEFLEMMANTLAGIVERNRAEEEYARLATAVAQAADGVVITDADGVIQYVNPAFSQMTGYSREEAMGQNSRILKSGKQDESFYKNLWDTIRRGERWKGNLTNKRKDGTLYEEEATISPVRDSLGTLVNFVVVKHDVTKERQMGRQLFQAQKLEAIGQLAAGIAHEINTPTQFIGDNIHFLQQSFGDLSGILTRLEALLAACKQGEDAQPLAREIETLVEQADMEFLIEQIPKAIERSLVGIERVTRIVRAMKDFSHPADQERTLVDVNKAIETTVTVARNEWKYVAEMETQLEPALPPIPCYPGPLNQVILNLIVNAAHAIGERLGKASETKGTIRIATRQDGPWVEIRISDTGTGIPESARGKIFDPFFTTKPVGKGTGQGLSISHSVIVEQHQGTISFETALGEGTTFIVRLPVEAGSEKNPSAGERAPQ